MRLGQLPGSLGLGLGLSQPWWRAHYGGARGRLFPGTLDGVGDHPFTSGNEWGTGYLFDVPGCWHLHLQRSGARADVWLSVEP